MNSMNEEQENKTEQNTTVPLYPEPTRGNLADDHSQYAKPIKFAGGDPDKHNKLYFILFLIVMGVLFSMAITSLSGDKFLF